MGGSNLGCGRDQSSHEIHIKEYANTFRRGNYLLAIE